MGVESYFMRLLISDGVVFNLEDFIERVKDWKQSVVFRPNDSYWEWIVEDLIFMSVSLEEGQLKTINLEGSFSWYSKGLELCYDIALLIHEEIVKIEKVTINPNFEFEFGGKDDFIQNIKRINEHRLHIFHSKYGVEEFPSKSRSDFYRRTTRREHFFRRWFRRY